MTGVHRRVVVKLGGRTQSDPLLPAALAELWTSTGGGLVVVHGGGDQISAMQRAAGEEPVFIGGRRVTTPLVLNIVRMVLSGLANKQIVSAMNDVGVAAAGVSGEDDSLLCAEPIDRDTFGLSGTPTSVNSRIVDTLLAAGILPVVSPVARYKSENKSNATADILDDGGHESLALNVNGDDAAAAIAAGIHAQELFLLADVAGVLDANKSPISTLTMKDVRELIDSGVAAGGMAAKIDAASIALARGVPLVRIGNLDALNSTNAGTRIINSPN